MPKRDTVLYVTVDGLMQPLGYSQVFRVVRALGARGIRYHVVSLERTADLADVSRRQEMQRAFAEVGVAWSPLPFAEGGGGRRALQNLATLTGAAVRVAVRHDVGMVHARAYHGAVAARAVGAARGVPFLFDTRSYWIDERREAGQWFRSEAAYAVARRAERALFRASSAAVTLTALQADDLRGGRFGAWSDRPLDVIPTCADFAAFVPREQALQSPLPSGGLTLGLVGSVNASYRSDRAIAFVRRVLELRPDARVVGLSESPDVYAAMFRDAGIAPNRTIVRRVEHAAIAPWIAALDWGLLVLKESPSKRASMPTKLAEFFACGVSPVHYGCNTEVGDWIARTGLGLTLASLEDDALEHGARRVAAASRDPGAVARARAIAEPHFSLASGIDRYERIVCETLARGQRT